MSLFSYLKTRRHIKKGKHLLFQVYNMAIKKQKKLTLPEKKEIKIHLEQLEQSIQEKNPPLIQAHTQSILEVSKKVLKKPPLQKGIDFILAIAASLFLALMIRQMWFELYEIPTGSMRPTFQEKDRLTVSKLNFGLNIPFCPKHFYFNPELIERMGTVIFTGEGMDISDVDTMYFYIFPGKKLYVKRLIALPGDTLYFYGGELFGIDKEGRDISSKLNLSLLDKIDHIPFIRFENKKEDYVPSTKRSIPTTLYQMNYPIAELSTGSSGKVETTYLIPPSIRSSNEPIQAYQDLWGIKNYAMVRLLSRKELLALHPVEPSTLPNAPLFLEIRHDPNTANAKLALLDTGAIAPTLDIEVSLLPLNMTQAKALFDNLYTARFEVKNGYLTRYGAPFSVEKHAQILPYIPNIPDGSYEFYYGKAYEILWQGIRKELPNNHPLYEFTLARLQLFFNLGIDFNLFFSPLSKHGGLYPSRYAYFRDNDLYVMGAKIIDKEDPALKDFIKKEKEKASFAPPLRPYFPFVDHKRELFTGDALNGEFIKKYGLRIPEDHYLVLGDNHAMSGDSREFGFVPSGNLRGAPDFIFWPPGSRLGHPNQPPYPLFNNPRLIVWSLFTGIVTVWTLYRRRKYKLPLDLSFLSN